MKTYFKKSKIYLLASILVLSVIMISISGCTKEYNPPEAIAIFPNNTEWVGTLDGSGFEYRLPCSLKFNDDNTFTMYALFVFFPNGVETFKDSIVGTINSMETLTDGRIRIATDITTSFNGRATKYLYIIDKNKIQGFDEGLNFENFQLSLFPAEGISVAGSWRGPAWKGGFAYPDLGPMQFDNANPNIPVTHYQRNGIAVRIAADPTSGELGVIYQQKGARVYFSGYNEEKNGGLASDVPYFGVMLPTGDKMMVHSRAYIARLPNYINTNEPYGANGLTPTIEKY